MAQASRVSDTAVHVPVIAFHSHRGTTCCHRVSYFTQSIGCLHLTVDYSVTNRQFTESIKEVLLNARKRDSQIKMIQQMHQSIGFGPIPLPDRKDFWAPHKPSQRRPCICLHSNSLSCCTIHIKSWWDVSVHSKGIKIHSQRATEPIFSCFLLHYGKLFELLVTCLLTMKTIFLGVISTRHNN